MMYSVNGFWCLLDGIHVIFLCVIMVVIFWRIKISDIVLMGIMVFFCGIPAHLASHIA